MSSQTRRRRESPRERRLARAAKISKMTQPVHNIPIYEILNGEGVELIHEKSMKILAEVGVDFYYDEAQQILKAHGVEMKGEEGTGITTTELVDHTKGDEADIVADAWEGVEGMMPAFGALLGEDRLWKIANYITSK